MMIAIHIIIPHRPVDEPEERVFVGLTVVGLTSVGLTSVGLHDDGEAAVIAPQQQPCHVTDAGVHVHQQRVTCHNITGLEQLQVDSENTRACVQL